MNVAFPLAFFFGGAPGGHEMIFVLLAILLLFGAKRLPEIARSLGRSMEEFRRAARDVTDEIMNADKVQPKSPEPLPPGESEPVPPARSFETEDEELYGADVPSEDGTAAPVTEAAAAPDGDADPAEAAVQDEDADPAEAAVQDEDEDEAHAGTG